MQSKKSDTEWVRYWDKLMNQSAKPIDWGTIVHEKPKHKNLTVTEEAKVHKTSKRKFKIKHNNKN